MKKILSLSVICSFFLFVGQISFASFNQEQETETVEVTESMQEVEQSVAEEPQSIGSVSYTHLTLPTNTPV